MVAFNFQKQFADLVEAGKKRQTICENPRGAMTGKKLQLYYGQRTKQCRKLLDVICKRTVAIDLFENRVIATTFDLLDDADLEQFARMDGFNSYSDMWKFFKKRAGPDASFSGWLIEW